MDLVITVLTGIYMKSFSREPHRHKKVNYNTPDSQYHYCWLGYVILSDGHP